MPLNLYAGDCIEAFTAVAKDSEVLGRAASGGVVTTLVRHLLKEGQYDCAFLVDGHNYANCVSSVRKTADDDLMATCKSRYVPVMQTQAVEYMLGHPQERMIFVGVPCFIQGLLRIMALRGIDRGRHLLIGLFCESTVNYNIWDYIGNVAGMVDMKALHFKDKTSGGNGKLCSSWPGDVCVFGRNGETHFLPKKVRADAKRYFSPERCLYCVDKLNQFADVSVGDNYTKRNSPRMGSSSVIVRTKAGLAVKNESLFDIFPESFDAICKAQGLSDKRENLCYQRFCTAESLIRNDEFPPPDDIEKLRPKYEAAKRDLAMGAACDFAGISEEIKRKALEKKRRKSLLYKLLHLFGLK